MRFRELRLLNEANIVNPHDIDAWVEKLVTGTTKPFPQSRRNLIPWLIKRVRQKIVGLPDDQASRFMDPVSSNLGTLATQYGDWVRAVAQRGETLFVFDPKGFNLLEDIIINHVLDYIISLDAVATQPQEHEVALQDEAKRQLSKITRLTLDQTYEHANQWFARLQAAGRERAERAEDASTKPVMNFHDGFRWVRIIDPVALDREGSIMQHCVGGGSYDEEMQQGRCEIYSLRDKNNQPHVTIDVVVMGQNKDNREIEQIKGKQNTSPVQKYAPYISAFLNKSGLQVGKTGEQDLQNTMLVQRYGQWVRFQEAFEPFDTVAGFDLYEGPHNNLFAIRGNETFRFQRTNNGSVLDPNNHQLTKEDEGLTDEEYAAIANTLVERGYKLSGSFELRLDSRFLAVVDGKWQKVSSLPAVMTAGNFDVKVTTDGRYQRIWFEDHSGDGNSAVLILAQQKNSGPTVANFFLRGDEWWSSQHRAPGLNAAMAEALNHLKIDGHIARHQAIPPQQIFIRYVKFENGEWVARGY